MQTTNFVRSIILLVSLMLSNCRAIQPNTEENAQNSISSINQDEANKIDQLAKKLRFPVEVRAELARMGRNLHDQAEKTTEKIRNAAQTLANGSAEERAELTINILEATVAFSISPGVAILVYPHSEQAAPATAKMKVGFANYFRQKKIELTSMYRKNNFQFPDIFRGVFTPKELSSMLVNHDPNEGAKVASVFESATDDTALALTTENNRCHPLLSAPEIIRQCSKQELGIRWIELGVSMLFFLCILGMVLQFFNAGVLTVPFVVISVFMIIRGGFLAWGQ